MELDLFARLRAKPGRGDAVLAAVRAVREPTRREPGCLEYRLFQDIRNPEEFVIHTRWRDRAAFEHHAELPHTVQFLETVEPLLEVPLHVALTAPLP